jgi:hypothetical protein
LKILKNIFIGFLVSFLGSIPLGYLNIIGFEIYSKFGIVKLVLYLLGIIFIEVFVVYFTLIFAKKLSTNQKLMKTIDILAIFFLIILGYSFYAHANSAPNTSNSLDKYITYSPFLIGVFLNCLNFLQLPFWTGWNLYLINGNYISTEKKLKFYYIAGTVVGIFLGMLGLILFLNTISAKKLPFTKYIMPVIIPLFFVIMALFQVHKVYKRYWKITS